MGKDEVNPRKQEARFALSSLTVLVPRNNRYRVTKYLPCVSSVLRISSPCCAVKIQERAAGDAKGKRDKCAAAAGQGSAKYPRTCRGTS